MGRLRERAPGAEIIMVDGGSSDGSRERAYSLCDRLVQCARGRGAQMNAGAKAAHGDIFWFLHVDSEPPVDCLKLIAHALSAPQNVGGFFRIRLPRGVVYRLTDSFAHYAGALLRIRCGDHGIFCRREIFERIGGFPEIPLMEDVEFFRSMYRFGKVQCVSQRLLANPRSYERVGALRLTLAYGLIASLYAIGVPSRVLVAIYRRTCSGSTGSSPAAPLHPWRWRSNAGSRSRVS